MNIWKKIKKKITDYLADMEKENKKVFGSGTPDCCSMNNQVTKK